MCCKIILEPYNEAALHTLVELFGFQTVGSSVPPQYYNLYLPGLQKLQIMKNSYSPLEINLYPQIHGIADHLGRRFATSIYLEFANMYAELVGGTATQKSIAPGCSGIHQYVQANGTFSDILVAQYPEMPMTHQTICTGLQAAHERNTI